MGAVGRTRFGYEQNPVGALNEDPDVGLPPAEVTLAEHVRNSQRDFSPWELYDLGTDLGESVDLAETHRETRCRLLASWERLRQEMAPGDGSGSQ